MQFWKRFGRKLLAMLTSILVVLVFMVLAGVVSKLMFGNHEPGVWTVLVLFLLWCAWSETKEEAEKKP